MHYYQFNIKDYQSHTRHLTVIEDLCYRRALDYYHLHELPLTDNVKALARVLILSEYQEELTTVLNEFFIKEDAGYVNTRADKDIKQYQGYAEAGKRGANKRWLKVGDSPPISPPKQPPMLTNNNKPLTNNNKQTTTVKQNNITPRALLEAESVPKNLIDDWLQIRKAKRATLTATALTATKREADKANITLIQAIEVCCESSWAGFKAEYVSGKSKSFSNAREDGRAAAAKSVFKPANTKHLNNEREVQDAKEIT